MDNRNKLMVTVRMAGAENIDKFKEMFQQCFENDSFGINSNINLIDGDTKTTVTTDEFFFENGCISMNVEVAYPKAFKEYEVLTRLTSVISAYNCGVTNNIL